MSIDKDKFYKEEKLYKEITNRYKWFKVQATKHKRLNRTLWLTSAIISVILAIILPLVTGYVMLRTPEKLWILETSYRNQLKNLSLQLEFQFERNPKFDRQDFEKKYFDLMTEANDKRVDIKSGGG